MGTPDKPLTAEERELLQRDVDILQDNFIAAVSTNRNLPKDDVKVLADGSSMLGEMALNAGLIDQIGGWDAVTKYVSEKIGESTDVCWNAY